MGMAKSPGQTPGPGWTNGQTDMPEWVQPPQVNAKCDVVMKLSVFWHQDRNKHTHTHTHTHTRQNLYILAMRAVIKEH